MVKNGLLLLTKKEIKNSLSFAKSSKSKPTKLLSGLISENLIENSEKERFGRYKGRITTYLPEVDFFSGNISLIENFFIVKEKEELLDHFLIGGEDYFSLPYPMEYLEKVYMKKNVGTIFVLNEHMSMNPLVSKEIEKTYLSFLDKHIDVYTYIFMSNNHTHLWKNSLFVFDSSNQDKEYVSLILVQNFINLIKNEQVSSSTLTFLVDFEELNFKLDESRNLFVGFNMIKHKFFDSYHILISNSIHKGVALRIENDPYTLKNFIGLNFFEEKNYSN